MQNKKEVGKKQKKNNKKIFKNYLNTKKSQTKIFENFDNFIDKKRNYKNDSGKKDEENFSSSKIKKNNFNKKFYKEKDFFLEKNSEKFTKNKRHDIKNSNSFREKNEEKKRDFKNRKFFNGRKNEKFKKYNENYENKNLKRFNFRQTSNLQVFQDEDFKKSEDFIYGRKIVNDAILKGISINKIYFAKNLRGFIIDDIVNHCRKTQIAFSFLDRRDMDKKFGDFNQGIVAYISPKKYIELDDIFERLPKNKINFVCLLDNITDPHNTGAIIRSAYSFGAKAVLIPDRNSCLVNSTVVKVSAGAANFIDIAKIGNSKNCIDKLKQRNFFVIGSDTSENSVNLSDLNFKNAIKTKKQNICIVLGNESEGIRRIIKENCDLLVKIDMKNKFDSLNVSCAAAVIFYELSQIIE